IKAPSPVSEGWGHRYPFRTSYRLLLILRSWLPGTRIQYQYRTALAVAALTEVEHLRDRICDRVKRTLTDALPSQPVVFDEPQHRGLIGDRMVHVVCFCPRRNHQQWLTRAITAAPERVQTSWINSRQRRGSRGCPAESRRSKSVLRTRRLVHDWAHFDVVPPVRIVIQDDQRRAAPVSMLLQEDHHVHHEGLLIQRIRIAGVAILIRRSLQ